MRRVCNSTRAVKECGDFQYCGRIPIPVSSVKSKVIWDIILGSDEGYHECCLESPNHWKTPTLLRYILYL